MASMVEISELCQYGGWRDTYRRATSSGKKYETTELKSEDELYHLADRCDHGCGEGKQRGNLRVSLFDQFLSVISAFTPSVGEFKL
jgi:hypothetical protein